MDYITAFRLETDDLLQKRSWTDLQTVANKIYDLLNTIDEATAIRMIQRFVFCVSKGEVSKELFEHNLIEFSTALEQIQPDKIQIYLGLNYPPTLFLSPPEIVEKIDKVFATNLQVTEEIKKELTPAVEDLDLTKSLQSMMAQFDPSKLPPTKRRSKSPKRKR